MSAEGTGQAPPAGRGRTRLFSNSFVARTGVDGNHRMYVVDVPPGVCTG